MWGMSSAQKEDSESQGGWWHTKLQRCDKQGQKAQKGKGVLWRSQPKKKKKLLNLTNLIYVSE